MTENKQIMESSEPKTVFEAELMEDNEDISSKEYLPENLQVPKRSLAEKIGRVAGATVAIFGIMKDFKQLFPKHFSNTADRKNINTKRRNRFRSGKKQNHY